MPEASNITVFPDKDPLIREPGPMHPDSCVPFNGLDPVRK